MKNSVLKKEIDTVRWAKAAAVRAVKTAAQTAVGVIGAATVLGQVSWQTVISAAVLSGILSVLTSVAGLPEVSGTEEGVE